MILTFPEVISAEEQRTILAHVQASEFVDGRETASPALADRKNNEQIRRDSKELAAISAILLQALRRNERFLSATYPNQLHSLLVSRYRPGMQYGSHVDRALMGDSTVFRTDLSITLFLKAPEEYDGGELALESGSGEFIVKLPERAIVCYPTGQLHRVKPVTRGERLVIVAWIQSHVRDPAKREVLRDLACALESITASGGPQDAYEWVNKTHTNLLRRWSDV